MKMILVASSQCCETAGCMLRASPQVKAHTVPTASACQKTYVKKEWLPQWPGHGHEAAHSMSEVKRCCVQLPMSAHLAGTPGALNEVQLVILLYKQLHCTTCHNVQLPGHIIHAV